MKKRRLWTILIAIPFILLALWGIIWLYLKYGYKDEEPQEKPVIYLYPTHEQNISVKLLYQGKLTITYPNYQDGWKVSAKPDGTLMDLKDGKLYYYLFWEGIPHLPLQMPDNQGFCVSREEMATFLQKSLAQFGLLPKEYNELIVYWLPKLQSSPFYQVYFAHEEQERIAPLWIEPKPDNQIRVFLLFKPLIKPIEVVSQNLPKYQRKGFTVVEWGGTLLNNHDFSIINELF